MPKAVRQWLIVALLALIFAVRIFANMVYVPIVSVSAHDFVGHSALLVGISVGIFGFSQAFFQIPLGSLSDRLGRKNVILLGLFFLMLGCLLASVAKSLMAFTCARFLQGVGAIGSTIMACVSDVTTKEERTIAMAVVGIAIGFAFLVSMILGPYLNLFFSIQQIYFMISLMVLLVMILAQCLLPDKQGQKILNLPVRKTFKPILAMKTFRQVTLSSFSLHGIYTGCFTFLSASLVKALPEGTSLWQLYCIFILCGFAVAMPVIGMVGRQTERMRISYLLHIVLMCLSLALLTPALHWGQHTMLVLIVFYQSFVVLESLLPSMASQLTHENLRGISMGIYSTFDFLGIFAGGLVAGVIGSEHLAFVYPSLALWTLLWLISAWRMKTPDQLKEHVIHLPQGASAITVNDPGIELALFDEDKRVFYVVCDQSYTPDALEKLLFEA